MKGGSGSRIPAGMMSFVTNGRKNDTKMGKDEDLSLFRELKNRSNQQKHRNLFLHPLCLSDEFDTANCPFPNHHPNGTGNYQIFRIPPAKKGSDFLTENDKHDYDWLKTPPATPLFPSIEMEAANNNNGNNNNNATHGQLHQQEPLQQPLSRFAGGNKWEVSSRPSINNNGNGNIIQKPAHNQKPKLVTTSKNDVVQKRPSSSTSKTSSTSNSTSSKENPYHHKILGFSNETPPNLRTEQRSSSTTRGRAAIAPPRAKEATAARPRRNSCSPTVDRGRKPEPIVVKLNNKQQENKGTVLLGSRMVQKVINARNSASVANINTTSSTSNVVGRRLKDTKPDYSRPTNQKSAFGLSRNGNMIMINKTLISREKTTSK